MKCKVCDSMVDTTEVIARIEEDQWVYYCKYCYKTAKEQQKEEQQ